MSTLNAHSDRLTSPSSSRRSSSTKENVDLEKGSKKVDQSEQGTSHDEIEQNTKEYDHNHQDIDIEAEANYPLPIEAISEDIRTEKEQERIEVEREQEKEKDPNIVDWDGSNDPTNPRNYIKKRKYIITLLFGLYGILSPLASSMIAPAVEQISQDLTITSSVEQNMVVSCYMIGYIVGPLFIGPLSEVVGRRPVLITGNALFIIFNLLCSRASSFGELVVFRLISGFGGAAPISVGGGAMSDIWNADERGRAVALYSIGPLIGPSIGPIAGGFLVEHEILAGQQAWRWVFYITTMVAFIPAIIGAIYLPETFAPVLLKKKTKRLQKETGNMNLRSIHQKDETFIHLVERSLVRPIIMITTQPIVIVLALYLTILFGTYYIYLVTFTRVHQDVYHESSGIASLHYLSLALGFLIGRGVGTHFMDKFYRKLRDRNNGKGQPEMRLVVMVVPCFLIPSGMIIYGWTIQYRIFWLVPDIGSMIFGMGIMGTTFVVQTYTIDAYTAYAASALAATTSLRSGAAFGFPLFATKMYDALGYGWGNTLLALVAFVVGGPGTLCIYLYGPKLRKLSPYAAGDKY